jgi:maleate isomerase
MWHADGSGSRALIGLLTPHLDPVPESEFHALTPEGVSIHAARVPLGMMGPDGEIIPRIDPDIARAFSQPPAVDDAAALLSAISPNAVVYAFTSSSYILGSEADSALKQRLETRLKGTPVVIQTVALVTALRSLQANNIALIHPPWFSTELDALGAEYFRKQEISVVYHGSAKLRNDYGNIRPDQIFDWAQAQVPDNADAIVIGGGGFRAIGAIEALELELGRPVLSANQASFWLALRYSGIEDKLTNYGKIFQTNLIDS